jgi:glycosyltransferase involved in cell wall biosynthesis
VDESKTLRLAYLTTYLDEAGSRRFSKQYSPAGLAKKQQLLSALKQLDVTIVFSGVFGRVSLATRRGRVHQDRETGRIVATPFLFLNVLLSRLFNPFLVFALLVRLHREQPFNGLIYYNAVYESVLPAILAKWTLRIPIICQMEDGFHVRGVGPRALTSRLALGASRRFSNAVIANSEPLRSLFPELPAYLFRGIIEPPDDAEARHVPTSDRFVVVFSSSLDRIRGAPLLTAALPLLAAHPIRHKLEIHVSGYGDSETVGALYQAIRDYGRRGGVAHFHGFLHESALRDLWGKAHIFLSIQNPGETFSRFCFPSKLLAYYPYRRPIVTTRVADLSEKVAPGVVFIDYEPASLVTALERIIGDFADHSSRACAATDKMMERWSADRQGAGLTDFVACVLC